MFSSCFFLVVILFWLFGFLIVSSPLATLVSGCVVLLLSYCKGVLLCGVSCSECVLWCGLFGVLFLFMCCDLFCVLL